MRRAIVLIGFIPLAIIFLGAALAIQFLAPPAADAQATDRAAVVIRYLDAENRGDLDGAVAEFADNAVFIGARVTGACSQQAPCTNLESIRQQIQGNIALHSCVALRAVQVSGAVVTAQREAQNDTTRANGVERALQDFIALVPDDKITFLANLQDIADPQTAFNVAVGAGTQNAGTPLPNPTTPCPGLQ